MEHAKRGRGRRENWLSLETGKKKPFALKTEKPRVRISELCIQGGEGEESKPTVLTV